MQVLICCRIVISESLVTLECSIKAGEKLDKYVANVLPVKERKSHKVIHCPICSKIIQDSVAKKNGQDSIFCNGECQKWDHRQCAGLSTESFTSFSTSDQPFYCPRCLLSSQAKELTALKNTMEDLSLEVCNLHSQVIEIYGKLANTHVSKIYFPLWLCVMLRQSMVKIVSLLPHPLKLMKNHSVVKKYNTNGLML